MTRSPSALFAVALCLLAPSWASNAAPLKVVATTSIVGDIVKQVGGDLVDVGLLIPPGADPHAFEPTPRDAVTLAAAEMVFANGAGLEPTLEHALEQGGARVTLVELSKDLPLRHLGQDEACAAHCGDHSHHHHAGDEDPHVWFDPMLVSAWVDSVAEALSKARPAEREALERSAESYKEKLEALDAWIRVEVDKVPAGRRVLVTDHNTFGYFAARYGFEVLGAVIPAFSTAAEPSAKDIAKLHDAIPERGVKALFIGTTVAPDLAKRVAQDTGIRIVSLDTCSLRAPGEPSSDYLSFMSNNVAAIVGALSATTP